MKPMAMMSAWIKGIQSELETRSKKAQARSEMMAWMNKTGQLGGDPKIGWRPKAWKEAGMTLGEADRSGWTLAHWAASRGWVEGLQELRALEAKMDAADRWGRTPLIIAAKEGSDQMAAELIAGGAKVGGETNNGTSALLIAIQGGEKDTAERRRLIQRLIGEGADLTRVDQEGRGPLHRAAWASSIGIARLLLSAGADPEQKERKGLSFWELARAMGEEMPIQLGVRALSERKDFADWAREARASGLQKEELEKLAKEGVAKPAGKGARL